MYLGISEGTLVTVVAEQRLLPQIANQDSFRIMLPVSILYHLFVQILIKLAEVFNDGYGAKVVLANVAYFASTCPFSFPLPGLHHSA